MPIPYDTSPKALSEAFPADWVGWLGWPTEPVEVVDADVATVSGAADKVFRVGRDKPWLLLLEFLSSYRPTAPERLHWHRTLIAHRHQLPVRSVILLLKPEADGPSMTGLYEEQFPDALPEVTFRYRIVRLWQIPADDLLKSGLGSAFFAPIGRVEADHLAEVVREVRRRTETERPNDAKDLLAAMYILMGLRYDETVINKIRKEVEGMEESITYQEIKGSGRLEDAREFVLLIGADRFGPADDQVVRTINSVSDVKKLHQIGRRVSHVNSWKELLDSD